MNTSTRTLFFAALLAIGLGFAGELAPAATPSFTLAAGNATMTAGGSGSVSWSVTSVNGFTGLVRVDCNPVSVPAGAKLPYCGASVAPTLYQVPANGVVTGSLALFGAPIPCSNPCPVKLDRPRHGFATGMALAGVLLVGLGSMRRRSRWFALVMFAAGSLACMAGIGACGGSSSEGTLTAGVWPYSVVASEATSAGAPVSTTVSVTVPPGVRGTGLQ